MVIGVCTIQLYLPGNASLKGKRQVIKSVMARLHREFNVAIAEVDDQDIWQQATLGVACVSTSTDHAHSVLTNVINWIEANRPDVPLGEVHIELL